MNKRDISKKIEKAIQRSPAVAILGPRQVGKTTLALEIGAKMPSIYFDLESVNDRLKLKDPEEVLPQYADRLVILDEVHRMPGLFPILRGIIDKNRRAGKRSSQFLLLGSASWDLLQQSGESLAGRIEYIDMPVIQAIEVPTKDLTSLWVRGGFPESFLAPSDEESLRWRLDFVKTYLEREIPQFGFNIPAATMGPFWTMLAHEQACLVNASAIAKNLDNSYKTVSRYIDLMVDLLLVRKLLPWYRNVGKRVTKAPKVFFRDSGIVHALLGIKNETDLLTHPILGRSWEAFVIENILQACPLGVQGYFYRTSGGAEIDLILEFSGQKKWAIEIKRGISPKVSRGFYEACEDIEAEKRFLVYSGEDSFPLGRDIEVVGLREMVELVTATA
jgi:uncharacterized protein